MSDNEPVLDLEKLFLPAWAKNETTADNRFAHYKGDEGERPPRRGGGGGGGGGFRRGGPPGRRDDGPRPPRPRDDQRPPQGDRGPRRDGPPRPGQDRRGGGFRPRPGGGGPRYDDRRQERPPEIPLPELHVAVVVDDKVAESLVRQIRITGRAYPIFEIAAMIMLKPERFAIGFNVIKNAEGQVAQPLYLCAVDDTLWLNEDEAIEHVLNRHFNMFYQAERTATQPPKGVYTFVAQCGMSGVILGPPNYHGYQEQLRKLHSERFSRMPFDAFKSRVRIVRDEEVVKKWVEEQSWKTEYLCLNVPDSPRLADRESVVQHFRETHLSTIIRTVESHTLSGVAAQNLRSPGLKRLVRIRVEEQRRFPLKLVHNLSQMFAARGLQFFKRDKTVTHVAVARPHYLDLETSIVSDGVKKIIEFINAHPKCTRVQLTAALAPAPAAAAIPAPAPAAETPAPEATPAEGEAAATPAPASAPAAPEPTPEQLAINSDLHWLVHQGHVIELANGILETAKKPVPKPPPKPAPARPEGEAAAAPAAEGAPAEAPATPEGPAAEPPATSEANTADGEASVPAIPASEPPPADPSPAAPAA